MAKVAYKPIEETTACPHCGSTFGYYRRFYLSGWTRDNTLFNGREPYNSHMHDHLNSSKFSAWYYCMDCDKKVAKV